MAVLSFSRMHIRQNTERKRDVPWERPSLRGNPAAELIGFLVMLVSWGFVTIQWDDTSEPAL